ncbi:Hypothetical protein A7982_03929 [Minicystis rosea]|nr:Hypothetical protein A7982_03929 [Minicystis rosea]
MSALKKQKEELERRLQKLTAHERGDSQEIDVFARLQQAFVSDKIERQGRSGDIIHTVRHDFGGGLQETGTIVYECKDTLRWKGDFLTQTKKAGRAHGSLYRMLVTWAFPAGEKDLCVRDGVILAHPSKVVLLADVVRRMVIEVRRAGLTAEGQADKASSLYAYLTGDEFRSTFDGIVGAAEELEKLLRDEKQAHERTWGRRAQVHENLARKTAAIDGSIRGILEAPTAGAKVIDFPAKVGRRMRA